MESIGKKIKDLRESKNLSQEELGKLIKLSPAQIGMYEREKSSPPIASLEKMAKVFGVPITYFFTDVKLGSQESATSLQIQIKQLQDELSKAKTEHEKTKETLIRLIQERLGLDKKE